MLLKWNVQSLLCGFMFLMFICGGCENNTCRIKIEHTQHNVVKELERLRDLEPSLSSNDWRHGKISRLETWNETLETLDDSALDNPVPVFAALVQNWDRDGYGGLWAEQCVFLMDWTEAHPSIKRIYVRDADEEQVFDVSYDNRYFSELKSIKRDIIYTIGISWKSVKDIPPILQSPTARVYLLPKGCDATNLFSRDIPIHVYPP